MHVPGSEYAEWSARAMRIAPVIDGIDYYRFLRDALIRAQRQVLIVGWDLHSEVDLLRGDDAERATREEDWPVRLADLLLKLVQERDTLEIRLLIWHGASMFALERQHWPRMKRPWADHPRVVLEWDSDTPPTGSQHQKFVVIDDAIAFVGGMDLTSSRWDSHEHARDDPRRRLPGLLPLRGDPYHDLMLAIDGPAARALGEWGRERWKRTTGTALRPPPEPETESPDPWPEALSPMLRDRDCFFALTQPDFGGREEKRQVESSYVSQIAAAERFIFVESQYLAAGRIVDALCERLQEPDGPEVVLILPPGCPGKLQAMSMDPRRDALLDRLREADSGGRLGTYWATLSGGSTEDVYTNSVYIHAKTMVVDDRLLRIGSANLNNRSMGLDTELDVFIAVEDGDGESAIAGYRRRLLSYLLHVDVEDIAAAEREHGSLVSAIEALRGGECTLHPFEHRAETLDVHMALPIELADPDRPLDDQDAERVLATILADKDLAQHIREGYGKIAGFVRHRRRIAAGAAALVLLSLGWLITPGGSIVDHATLRTTLDVAAMGVVAVTLGSIAWFLVGLFAPGARARWSKRETAMKRES